MCFGSEPGSEERECERERQRKTEREREIGKVNQGCRSHREMIQTFSLGCHARVGRIKYRLQSSVCGAAALHRACGFCLGGGSGREANCDHNNHADIITAATFKGINITFYATFFFLRLTLMNEI